MVALAVHIEIDPGKGLGALIRALDRDVHTARLGVLLQREVELQQRRLARLVHERRAVPNRLVGPIESASLQRL